MKFKTQWNRKEFPAPRYEINNEISKTIPDQSMTVQELYNRHARGLPLDGARFAVYEGDEPTIPADYDRLDLSEKFELARINQQHLEKLQKDLAYQEEKRKYEEYKEKFKQEEIPFEEIKPEEQKQAKNQPKPKNKDKSPNEGETA